MAWECFCPVIMFLYKTKRILNWLLSSLVNRFRFLFCDLTAGKSSWSVNKCSFVYLCLLEREEAEGLYSIKWQSKTAD